MSNFTITKPGFYKTADFETASVIEIADNLEVSIFDTGKINKKIKVGSDVVLYIFGLLEKEDDYSCVVKQIGDNSEVIIKYLVLAKNSKTKSVIHSRVESNDSKSDVEIVAFAAENGEVDIDGIIDLAEGYKNMAGHLLEENIFLGDSAKVRGLPTLLVASDEVEASHACKIHKISDEKLFYMRSRGITRDTAQILLIKASITRIFGGLKNYDKNLFESTFNHILGAIFEK